MKKVIVLLIFTSVVYTKLFSQELNSKKIYIDKSIIKKPNTALISTERINNEDSIIDKTKNGFDIKKSKVDNMPYLNANKDNHSNGKMPIDSSVSIAKMPTRKLPTVRDYIKKDTTFTIKLNNDSFKKKRQ
jgi:hypothetical protein